MTPTQSTPERQNDPGNSFFESVTETDAPKINRLTIWTVRREHYLEYRVSGPFDRVSLCKVTKSGFGHLSTTA